MYKYYNDVVELTNGVNGGEAVFMRFTKDICGVVEDGYVLTEIELNSYSSVAKICFGGLTPEVLREAADKLEKLLNK